MLSRFQFVCVCAEVIYQLNIVDWMTYRKLCVDEVVVVHYMKTLILYVGL
jgi:hypothetical protein